MNLFLLPYESLNYKYMFFTFNLFLIYLKPSYNYYEF